MRHHHPPSARARSCLASPSCASPARAVGSRVECVSCAAAACAGRGGTSSAGAHLELLPFGPPLRRLQLFQLCGGGFLLIERVLLLLPLDLVLECLLTHLISSPLLRARYANGPSRSTSADCVRASGRKGDDEFSGFVFGFPPSCTRESFRFPHPPCSPARRWCPCA